jgi:YD repeat-containing protein
LAGTPTRTTYDHLNRPIEVVDGLLSLWLSTTFAYDAAGNLRSNTQRGGLRTAFTHDDLGRRLTVTEADQDAALRRTTTTTFDKAGNVTEVTEPSGRRTLSGYDALNRLTSLTEAAGLDAERTTTFAYDDGGRLVGQTVGLAPQRSHVSRTEFDYDALGRRTDVIEAVGEAEQRATVTFFDAADNPVQVISPGGWFTFSTYDALNQLRQQTEAEGTSAERTATFAYDKVGNLTGQTTGLGAGRGERAQAGNPLRYDALNRHTLPPRPTTTTLPRLTTMAYDARDHVYRIERPSNRDGQPFRLDTFEYDILGRQTRATEDALDIRRSVATRYDTAGRVLSMTDPRGSITSFAYDALDRRTKVIEAWQPEGLGQGCNGPRRRSTTRRATSMCCTGRWATTAMPRVTVPNRRG